ncbi:hypothetical protein CQ047_18250 [Microbacterium sp. MYb72]|uniref:hypothetical protein n=1 Tax=Microbacterium sp. MYb72 TaxID=1848693 RepID=UPI000CFB7A2C|nr:hypothetical protein [Microbacterium sp. MYb72]PRB01800.1 hypothetical protein CQ047_18250 [Microbacterium sp. MYb72]
MNWLAIAAKWFGLALAALSFGWTVGGHVDLVSLAGVIGLVIWRLAQLLIDFGRWGAGLPAGESGSAGRGTVGTDAPTEPDLSRLDRLDGVGNGR